MDSLNFKYCISGGQENAQHGLQFAGITSRFTVPEKENISSVQGSPYSSYIRSCKSGKKTNSNQENKQSSNAERSRDNTKTSSNKINRTRYNRHSSSDLDESPEARNENEEKSLDEPNEKNSPGKRNKKPVKTTKKVGYRPITLMSRTSINRFIKEKESKLAKTNVQTEFRNKNANFEIPKESKPGIKMKDQDIHQMPCGESGREAGKRRKRQKEGKSKEKRSKGRRKSTKRRKSSKKRKTGKRKSRSRKRSRRSKSRSKSPKSKTRRRRRRKSSR